MDITIDELKRYESNQNGEPYKTKAGKPFARFSIKSGQIWYKGADFDGWTKNWQPGQTIQADVIEKEYNGTTYLELQKPSKTYALELRIEALEQAMRTVVATLKNHNII